MPAVPVPLRLGAHRRLPCHSFRGTHDLRHLSLGSPFFPLHFPRPPVRFSLLTSRIRTPFPLFHMITLPHCRLSDSLVILCIATPLLFHTAPHPPPPRTCFFSFFAAFGPHCLLPAHPHSPLGTPPSLSPGPLDFCHPAPGTPPSGRTRQFTPLPLWVPLASLWFPRPPSSPTYSYSVASYLPLSLLFLSPFWCLGPVRSLWRHACWWSRRFTRGCFVLNRPAFELTAYWRRWCCPTPSPSALSRHFLDHFLCLTLLCLLSS